MIVVSNTSPLTNLASIGRLDLLQRLYGKVIVPKAVHDELTVYQSPMHAQFISHSLPWLETIPVEDCALLNSLLAEVDAGEAEVITLALQIKADLILMDERIGRSIAQRIGLDRTGVIGVLFEAKKAGLIPNVKTVLDELITIGGFWMSHDFYIQICENLDKQAI